MFLSLGMFLSLHLNLNFKCQILIIATVEIIYHAIIVASRVFCVLNDA